jgi:hypothetical protein
MRACIGSGGAGLSFCWANMVMPISTGNTKNGSWTLRSSIHRNNGA